MSYDPMILMTVAASSLVGLAMLVFAALSGWRGWLDLQRQQLTRPQASEPAPPSPTARIELADLKERVRKLEAIAAGVEL